MAEDVPPMHDGLRAKTLDLAFERPEDYYNQRTQIIAVEGPRGPILGYYLRPSTRPRPDKHRFLTYYKPGYRVFEGTRVPKETKANVDALVMPVPKTSEKRVTVESGKEGGTKEDTSPSSSDFNITTSGSTMADANGASFRRHSIQMHMDGAGMSIAGGKVGIKGQVEHEQPQSRGITQESPVWSIIPKSAVTFFVSDHLPNTKKMKRLGTLMLLLSEAIRLVTKLVDLSSTVSGTRQR